MDIIDTPKQLRTTVESLRSIDLNGWELTDLFRECDRRFEAMGSLLRLLQVEGRLPEQLATLVVEADNGKASRNKAVFYHVAASILPTSTETNNGVIHWHHHGHSDAYLKYRRQQKLEDYRNEEVARLEAVVNCLLTLDVWDEPDDQRSKTTRERMQDLHDWALENFSLGEDGNALDLQRMVNAEAVKRGLQTYDSGTGNGIAEAYKRAWERKHSGKYPKDNRGRGKSRKSKTN